MNNYRPVSNLNFLSKVLERLVSSRLKAYLTREGLASNFQSAYRECHSTETALLRVHNDIIRWADQKHCTALVLLDLSAAFDTIDQDLLLHRLRTYFGIKGKALEWIASYLTERSQSVQIFSSASCSSSSTGAVTSTAVPLCYGVPQGSVLGPVLFTLYTTPLSDIIEKHELHHHLYADDTQVYIPISEGNEDQQAVKIKNCLNEIKDWMLVNKLKLNDNKTEIMLLGTNQQRANIAFDCLEIGNATISIESTKAIRNLGFYFDPDLSMKTQGTMSSSMKICLDLLVKTSRSFAAVIQALDEELR
ncbi:hypothetical protein EGW08_016322 [Elysia chlorotica]|uniref:Reverse transcriptase domain-containing protein n=1 Tax=Elysia chlorotica TaxID=188477 RepID=A0A3S1B4L4_ELYCH|nr:hypothetical protein EGW08_016322 [Elysia chlorotica]